MGNSEPPEGTLCTTARSTWLRENHPQQQPDEVEQLLQSQATERQQLQQKQEERVDKKKQQWLQGRKPQRKADPRQHQRRRDAADGEEHGAAQQQEKPAPAAQSACLEASPLAQFNFLSSSLPQSTRQIPRNRSRSPLVLRATAAVEEPPVASARVDAVVGVAAANAAALTRASATAVLNLPAGTSGPTAAIVDFASRYATVGGLSASAAGALPAAGRVGVTGRPGRDLTDSASTAQCFSASMCRSKYSLGSCYMPLAPLLQVLLPLLLLSGPLLLSIPMYAKALSLRTLEKPPLPTRLLPRSQTAEYSRRVLLCDNGGAPLSPTVSAPSGAAATPSTYSAQPPRAAAAAAQGAVATPPTADFQFSAAVATSSAAAARRSLSAVRGEDGGRGVPAAAAPLAAGGTSLTAETAAATHLQAAVAFTASFLAAAAASASRQHRSGPYKSRFDQQQQRITATTTPPSRAVFRRWPSFCPASAAAAAARGATSADCSLGAAAVPAATLLPFAAADSVSCSARAKPLAASKSAASSLSFIPRHSHSVALNVPRRAAPASPSAGLAPGRSEHGLLPATTRITAAAATTAAPSAATPPGRSTGREAKTTAAAGSLRAAEYVGGGGGGRPRHWESSLNRVMLIGRVGAEPEIRQMTNGDKFAGFSVATSSHWVDKSTGELQARTEWHRVVVYDESLVDLVDKYLHTGRRIYVEGKLQTRRWTGSDGAERYTTSVVVSRYQGDLILLDQPAAATAPSLTDRAGPSPPRDEGTDLPAE